MSYRLEADERLPHGIQRIALERIDDALDYLQPLTELSSADDTGELNADEAIHESRKNFKKLRGLLRLVRKEIGEEVYQRENVCFRDAGRLLSEMRDGIVMVRTLDDLTAEFEEIVDRQALADIREQLVTHYQRTRQQTLEEEQAPAAVYEMIASARERVAGWPVNRHTFAAVSGGLRQVYKRGRNRLAEATEAPSVELFHEWRKRVKYLWYNIRILRPCWPGLLATLADEIHDLSDDLGEAHDLAELTALLQTDASLSLNEAAREVLFTLLDQQREQLETNALSLGQRIYAEKPDPFVQRMGVYWQAWQG